MPIQKVVWWQAVNLYVRHVQETNSVVRGDQGEFRMKLLYRRNTGIVLHIGLVACLRAPRGFFLNRQGHSGKYSLILAHYKVQIFLKKPSNLWHFRAS